MKIISFISIGLIFLFPTYSDIEEKYPDRTVQVNLLEKEKHFNDCHELFNEYSNSDSELNEEALELLMNCDETISTHWDIIGGGCSWYCGGEVKIKKASSELPSHKSITYSANNAHDLSYETAWIEGTDGYGIGEYLEYTFINVNPRITEIIVVNGYVKNKTVYYNNSRVKTLKVYYNNEPIALLQLEDIIGNQYFKFDPIGYSKRDYEYLKTKPDWKLKFEIIDVYKGLKYDDTAITEIYFDGIDVH